MYENYKHQEIKLSVWAEAFHNLFTLGELYRMAKDGMNFNQLISGVRYDLELGK